MKGCDKNLIDHGSVRIVSALIDTFDEAISRKSSGINPSTNGLF